MVARSSVSLASRARHRLRTRVAEYPSVYLPFARRKYPGPSPEVISPETELVIDGYTRSATTFAVYALQLSQPKPVRLAHHLHAPAQLIEAARRGVPALVLIREPQGAILSQVVREPWVSVSGALIAYSRFYTCLLPYRDRFVVGEFEQVTNDFGAVIRRLNTRFGTSFAEFEHTESSVREVLDFSGLRGTLSRILLGFESGKVSRAELDKALADLRAATSLEDREAWVPSASREDTKRSLRQQWTHPSLAVLRKRAETVHENFVGTEQP
ncbi:MAG: hypothetical protein WAL84_14055 [Candidatus Dormiibacterota bacterium]